MLNEITLLINDTEFVFWSNLKISHTIDAVSAASFSAPFDPNAEGFKENFTPFNYNPVVVKVNGEPIFTGTMIDIAPNVDSASATVDVSCYATCGVIQDCTPPADKAPFEYNNLNLKEIAEKMASYFNLNADFQGEPGSKFTRVACDPDKKVFDFLTELAKQRGYIISSNVSGDLVFWKSDNRLAQPVAVMQEGESPLLSITPQFKPQDFFSHLTGLSPVEVGKPAVKKTVETKKEKKTSKTEKAAVKKQPKPAKKYSKFSVQAETQIFRPLTFKIDDIEGVDVETAVKAKLARMLGNMASYTAEIATWRDVDGNLWAPNKKIKIKAPSAMVYDYFDFEIRSVDFSQDGSSETATLELSLPGSFSGEPPEIFPWEL